MKKLLMALAIVAATTPAMAQITQDPYHDPDQFQAPVVKVTWATMLGGYCGVSDENQHQLADVTVALLQTVAEANGESVDDTWTSIQAIARVTWNRMTLSERQDFCGSLVTQDGQLK